MNDPSPGKVHSSASLAEQVGAAADRKLKAQRTPDREVWFGLGMIGLIGWSVVVPTLLGAAIGTWLDKNHVGRHAWTLALMVAGLCLGCLNAWHWVAQQYLAMREGESSDRP